MAVRFLRIKSTGRIEHFMKEKACARCGKCCMADMSTFADDEDIARWRSEGRDDILASLDSGEKFWAGDRIVLSGGGRLSSCSFLKRENGLTCCSIYDTRPKVCREFQAGTSRLCSLWTD